MTKIANNEITEQMQVRLCSNIMREPQIFDNCIGPFVKDQIGPSVAGLCRDIMIWAAWNGSQYATLNVKQFAEMFGYSRPYLFKKLEPETIKNLKNAGFPKIKDRLGYALAKLVATNLTFAEGYTAVGPGGLEQRVTTSGVQLLQNVTVATSRLGTVFSIQVAKAFLDNCNKSTYFQRFNLADYISFTQGNSHAYSAARRMYLHLIRKRRVWDNAKKAPGVKPSVSNFEKLCAVAGFEYANPRRNAEELRNLLKLVGAAPGVKLSAEIKAEEGGKYSVKFTRDEL